MRRSDSEHYLIAHRNPRSPISEAFRTLRTNIQFALSDCPRKVIMAASAERGEGKTTTISNLAVTYAQEGKKVLIMDADLRTPSIHHVFALKNGIGLTNVLSGTDHWTQAVTETDVPQVSIMTAGSIPHNPSELLGSDKMKQLIEELKDSYDVILLDAPPVLAVTDSLILSSYCDGVILVVVAGKVEKDLVRKAKAQLEHVNANILGVVFNNILEKDSRSAYAYGTKG